MRVGIAADHGGFELKARLAAALKADGHDVADFGDLAWNPADDFPDFVALLAAAVANGEVERGVAVCASGVGACVAANKVRGVRAALISDAWTARQGVEDDDMNVLCLGAAVIGPALAEELARTFLKARFAGADRFRRRLRKVAALEASRSPGA
jgi:ribose 5-phosphate isomerase B